MMIRVVFGTRLAGVVDQVPDRVHVATRFFHIYWVPLVPLASFAVAADADDLAPVPLSGRSIAMAWIRLAAVLAGYLWIACAISRWLLPMMSFWWVLAGIAGFIASFVVGIYSRQVVLPHVMRALALGLIATLFTLELPHHTFDLPLGIGALALAWATLRWTRADDARAAELTALFGMSVPPPTATVVAIQPKAPPPPLVPLASHAPEAAPPPAEQPRLLR